MSTRFIARFNPQAWVKDYAIEVDPEGEQEWDATEFADALEPDHRALLLAALDGTDNPHFRHTVGDKKVLDNDDVFKSDPNAPEWVREYRGPFDIHIRREEEEDA